MASVVPPKNHLVAPMIITGEPGMQSERFCTNLRYSHKWAAWQQQLQNQSDTELAISQR